MSFSIPPSPELDREWALVPGNQANFYHAPIFEPPAQGVQAESTKKTSRWAFGCGNWLPDFDAGKTGFLPHVRDGVG